MKRLILTLAVSLAAAGCTKSPQPADTSASVADTAVAPTAQVSATMGLTGREWSLIQLGSRSNPLGAGGRKVTLNLESAETRATGFAGCNRYSGPYALSGDSLTFGPAISTKMACTDGMEVETEYLGALPKVTRYALADSTLTLFGTEGQLAVFR